jgi:hypothetical protein
MAQKAVKKFSSWHVAVAAEAASAALFARCGCDISVQYGADQPEYDLVVSRGSKMFKVSVKGSQDGGWGLTQSYIKEANYHRAIDTWLARHKERTVLCFVQFQGTALTEMPRAYLARPHEVAKVMKESCKGRGGTILWENHNWGPRAHGAGTSEIIPDTWKFSEARVDQLLAEIG